MSVKQKRRTEVKTMLGKIVIVAVVVIVVIAIAAIVKKNK